MGKKTNLEDTATLALLYSYEVKQNIMMSSEMVVEFDKMINHNLETMNSNVESLPIYNSEQRLFYFGFDENNKSYLIIDSKSDIEKYRKDYIVSLPLDIILASQMDNSLEILGLKLEDGKLKQNDIINMMPNKKKILTKEIK